MAAIYCSFCSAGRHPSFPREYYLNVILNPKAPHTGIVICDECREKLNRIFAFIDGGTTEYMRVRRDGTPQEYVEAVEGVERYLGLRSG